ncbi:MAG: hypothetical protein NTW14_01835 [bacterium]|nr:hypothetical protein [bacterium]
MRHTYVSVDCHLIFTTKDRQPVLSPDLLERLPGYFGGVAVKQ